MNTYTIVCKQKINRIRLHNCNGVSGNTGRVIGDFIIKYLGA